MQDLSYPLTLPEFAEQVAGRSADLIRTRVREGQIQCHRIGMRGHVWFTAEDVAAYLDATLVPARRPA